LPCAHRLFNCSQDGYLAGEKVPLKMNMNSPIATLVTGDNYVLFTRDTWLFLSPKNFRISPDGQRWADIYDLKAQKKLFGFKKGTASLGFHGTEKEGFKISIEMKAE
jgi:hypothetical protein